VPNLILTRRVGETILIGDNIGVTVVGVDGDHVRISIQAPREINIVRSELKQSLNHQTVSTPSKPAILYRNKKIP
jgi:carbon storage regulator